MDGKTREPRIAQRSVRIDAHRGHHRDRVPVRPIARTALLLLAVPLLLALPSVARAQEQPDPGRLVEYARNPLTDQMSLRVQPNFNFAAGDLHLRPRRHRADDRAGRGMDRQGFTIGRQTGTAQIEAYSNVERPAGTSTRGLIVSVQFVSKVRASVRLTVCARRSGR